jgi:hypothetical protein
VAGGPGLRVDVACLAFLQARVWLRGCLRVISLPCPSLTIPHRLRLSGGIARAHATAGHSRRPPHKRRDADLCRVVSQFAAWQPRSLPANVRVHRTSHAGWPGRTQRYHRFRFFEQRGHAVIASAPVVPVNDATTLFVSAGMQPLVPYFLSQQHPSGPLLRRTGGGRWARPGRGPGFRDVHRHRQGA